MNRKKNVKKEACRNLRQGLAGILLSVSVFVFPVTGLAEEASVKATLPPKVVMPQEQVYLDPSQVEAAQKQKEADAKYNSVPQNKGTAAAEVKKEIAEAKAPALEKETAEQKKYVMPQEQVYLDPSQMEAAKQQKQSDAFYNNQPQTKNVEVVTGDRVIADVKVVEQDKKEIVQDKTEDSQAKTEVSQAKKEIGREKQEVIQSKNEIHQNKKEINRNKQEAITETEKTAAQQKVIDVIEPTKDSTTTPGKNPDVKKITEENNAPVQPPVPIQQSATVKQSVLAQQSVPAQPPVPVQKPVRLHHFGVAKEITTHHGTVGDVLREMKINMEGRTVYPPSETVITDGMVIHVLARKSFLSEEEVEVPFGTQTIDDPEMAFGTKKVEKDGVKGKELVTYENITRPGHEQKIELARRRVAEPVNAIVRQGVAQSVLTPDGYVKYKKVIYGEATAYTWGGGASGHTSVGLWPKRGIVAVDPRVIPYYTKLYIPGYGRAIAGDTGGAIVGSRIDLFMDSLRECYQWGRRSVAIYILE